MYEYLFSQLKNPKLYRRRRSQHRPLRFPHLPPLTSEHVRFQEGCVPERKPTHNLLRNTLGGRGRLPSDAGLRPSCPAPWSFLRLDGREHRAELRPCPVPTARGPRPRRPRAAQRGWNTERASLSTWSNGTRWPSEGALETLLALMLAQGSQGRRLVLPGLWLRPRGRRQGAADTSPEAQGAAGALSPNQPLPPTALLQGVGPGGEGRPRVGSWASVAQAWWTC